MTRGAKQHWGIGIALALSISTMIGFAYLYSPISTEPAYKGKPLSTWLDRHVPTSAARPPFGSPGWHEANEAIRTIGSDAVPTLVSMLKTKDQPKWIIESLSFLRNKGLPLSRYRYASSLHQEAEYAFEILGEAGKSGVPELIDIYERNISRSSQRSTAIALGNIGREARKAIPTFLKRFNHPDPDVRFYAVSGVMDIGGEPERVVPALTAALSDSNVNVRWNALSGLGRFHRRAESAIPTILEMLDDPGKVGDSPIKRQVETTIWRVAPEHSPNALVVEANSPLVNEGRTTQELKALFQGSLKTLIQENQSVPILEELWKRDPRPDFALYRGDSGSNENDVLLGRFEVMGIPEERTSTSRRSASSPRIESSSAPATTAIPSC